MVKLDYAAEQLVEDLALAATTLEEIRRRQDLDLGLAALADTATARLRMIAHSLIGPVILPEAGEQHFVH